MTGRPRHTVRRGDVWAFDVDGTLVGSVRSDVLRPGAREVLAALDHHGAVCLLWSAGGADHAGRMAARHGFEDLIVACYGKEARDADGRYVTTHFPAHHRPSIFVDDAPDDLPLGSTVIAVPQFIGGNPADHTLRSLLAGFET